MGAESVRPQDRYRTKETYQQAGAGGKPAAPTVLLVHGAWHGPWCWTPLAARLSALGVQAEAVSLTSTGPDPALIGDLYSDAAAVQSAAERTQGPVVLVGHSYAGVVITEAAGRLDNAVQLIYLGAFLPEAGESLNSLAVPWAAQKMIDLSWFRLTPDDLLTVDPRRAAGVLYQDCNPDAAQQAVARLLPQSAASFRQPVTGGAGYGVPSLYIRTTDDRAIPPALQQRMAKAAGRTLDIPTGHAPFLSQPGLLAALVCEELRLGAASG